MRPKGSGGTGASAALVLLDDVPHHLRRTALHLPLRRSERGLLYFYHGLLERTRERDIVSRFLMHTYVLLLFLALTLTVTTFNV